eukprot:506213-Amphidinium_carterae.3
MSQGHGHRAQHLWANCANTLPIGYLVMWMLVANRIPTACLPLVCGIWGECGSMLGPALLPVVRMHTQAVADVVAVAGRPCCCLLLPSDPA